MKALLFCFLLLGVSAPLSPAQDAGRDVVPAGGASARDGFTKRGTDVLETRGGVSRVVRHEVVLSSGLRVRPDGSVILPNGQPATIDNNQLLTPDGRFETVALTPAGTAPVTSGGAPMRQAGEEVGVSANDGISVSGGTSLITRNGVTQRVEKELTLPNGTRVRPDGSVTLANGQQITLRANQVLTFDGLLLETPSAPAPVLPGPKDGGVLSPSSPATSSPR